MSLQKDSVSSSLWNKIKFHIYYIFHFIKLSFRIERLSALPESWILWGVVSGIILIGNSPNCDSIAVLEAHCHSLGWPPLNLFLIWSPGYGSKIKAALTLEGFFPTLYSPKLNILETQWCVFSNNSAFATEVPQSRSRMSLPVLELSGDNVEIKRLNSIESPKCFGQCCEGYKRVSALRKMYNLSGVIGYKLIGR